MGKKLTKKDKEVLTRPVNIRPKAVVENRVRVERTVIAYLETCTSPTGMRKFTHRTDVHTDQAEALERSKAFQTKYLKQGWGVTVRAVTR